MVGAGVIGLELGSVWRRLGAQGDGGGIPRRRAARHGRRSAPPGAAPVRKAGHDVQAVVQGHRGRRLGQTAEGDRRAGQRRRGRNHRGRRGAGCDRPRALHRRARPEGARRQARRARPRRGRSLLRDQRARHLGDRRRHRRADAGAQGRGRRRGGGRNPGRAGRPRELRRHPERGLHLSGNRHRRQIRGRTESRRRRLQCRQVSVHRQRPRQGQP